ncbi:MAG: penicillin-binding protein 1C, partial [Candidatus Eremiobacteraeota bacterium]|nr:penicillin-binding protein 1C [Candidatus Eremiobacteraeota bacterium]
GLTLGSGEVSLWQLAQAYTTLARRGDAVALTALSNEPVAARSIGDSRVWMLVTKMLADPHARALSFGVHSVLQLPFEAAVKTGTSSDYRDTWTVGFTRTYTVATWVGNFDGSPMQRVSGVAGAAPLWNRIMLHLHERRDPGRFEDPPGMHLTRICATTGAAPQRGCSAVVEEYLARAAPPPRRARMDGGILFPQNGAVFFLSTAPPNAPIMQRLEMRGAGDGPARRWTIDGAALPRDAEGHAFWTLRVGRWKLGYAGAGESRTVHFSVLAQPPRTRPGFTFGAPLEGTSGRRARESRVLRRSG